MGEYSNVPTPYAPTNASQVQIPYSPPQRAYTSIGIVSATRHKPGWTDPSVNDAIPQLQAAGAEIGADAVIVRSDRSNNDRHVVVEVRRSSSRVITKSTKVMTQTEATN